MVSLNLNNGSVAFTGLEGTVVLLDSEKPLENKSRVSMHRLADQKHPIISDILLKLIQRQQEEEADLAVPFGLLDALLTVRLIRSSKPVRVLAIPAAVWPPPPSGEPSYGPQWKSRKPI